MGNLYDLYWSVGTLLCREKPMTRTTLPLLLVLVLLGSQARVQAEEAAICRYCADGFSQFLPPGTTLEGKYHYAPDRQVDVQHIKLDVVPDFDKRTVAGTASIRATVIARPVELLRLDAINLSIKEVRCEGATVDDFYSTREDLQISFTEPVKPGAEITLHIDYSAEPVKGLYFRTPEMGYPKTDSHIWTQGEPHESRHWFPCFDYPNERSSTEIVCHVPRDMTVLSNGQRMGEDIDGNGLKVVRWLQEKPHVNYLMCLVAGHLEKLEKKHGDVALGFYTQPTLAKYAKNSFADTPAIMAFFEEEIGVPFPWVKYDQVTIRDFTAGGMENTTLTTLTHNTIFSADTENLRSTRRLDAHELAHQWFGDYVTCKDWSHLWLNEGFATYYTHLYEGHKFGRDAMLYGLAGDARGILRQKNDKKPIVYNAYKNPMEQFDYRSYPKGSWVLHMLRNQLGEDLYRKCIKTYLERHALTSVVSDDLRQVIEEISGRTMDRFFDQWLYHPRHPDLKITYKWMPKEKLAKISIRQTQKVDDDVVLYELPTKLRFVVDGKTIDREIVIRETEEDFYAPLPSKPSIVRFDPDFTMLAEISFDKPDDLWEAQVANMDDMMGRLLAVGAMGKRKTNKNMELLKKCLNEDPFFGVRMGAADALSKYDTDDAYEALRDSMQQDNAKVRQTVVGHLTSRFDDATPKLIREILASEKNPGIKATAVRALGRFTGEESRKAIIKQLNSVTFRNELAVGAISAIRQQNDPAFQKPLMKVLSKHEDRFTSRGFGQGLEALAQISKSSRKKDAIREFLLGYVNSDKTNIQTAAIRALGTLGDEKATAAIDAFKDSPKSSVAGAADRAASSLREQKPTAPREVIELRKEIAEMKKENEKLQKQFKEILEQMKAAKEPAGKKSEKDSASGAEKESAKVAEEVESAAKD